MAGNDMKERSLDVINELADVAGVLHRSGMVQCLHYSSEWMQEEYKLIELPTELTDVLQEGDVVTIRGDGEDEAVLCTKQQTYDMKVADTSNALLLLPSMSTPKSKDYLPECIAVDREVCCCFSSYYEVRRARPRLQRLRHLLDDNAYSNISNEDSVEQYDTNGLLKLIQASEEELFKELEYLGAFKVNGFWRVLDIHYQEKAFAQILALLEEKSWDWKNVPLKASCDLLEELYPRFVLKHCLKTYGSKIENNDSDNISFCLDAVKVCRFYAEFILRQTMIKFNYHEFMEAWSQSVPDGMTVSEDYLLGIALTDLNNHPPVIWHFSERNLTDDPQERFNLLFKTRPKWKEVEIEPYVKTLVAPGQKLSSLYLKYTRSSKDEHGNKIFNSKRPIL